MCTLVCISLLLVLYSDCRHCDDLPTGAVCVRGCSCCLRNSLYDDPSLVVSCDKEQTKLTNVTQDLNALLQGLRSNDILQTSFTMDGAAALHTVPSDLCTVYSLEELVLTNLGLTSVSAQCFSNMSNLVRWSMQFNKLVSLPNDLLVGQTKLAEFNLAHNDITDVHPELLQNTASVLTLKNIDFTFNRLTSLDIWPLFLRADQFVVDVAANNISTFTNKLTYKYTCAMPSLHGNVNLYGNNVEHFMDIVSGYGFKTRDPNFLSVS